VTPWYNPAVLLAPAQPLTPVIVRVVGQPAREISVADVLLGAVGITGVFLIGAALLGLALGGIFILFRMWQARRQPETPADNVFSLTHPPDTV
jgi:hypothetical protein